VVRHHDAVNNMDTLFHDQTVDVAISINVAGVPVYQEYHNGVTTTENGLVTIPIGMDDDQMNSILDVDWSEGADIVATFDLGIDGEEPISVTTPVQAMPYAIQARIGPLTTEMIADYSENTITDEGMTQILDAIRNNPNGLKDSLKNWVIDYMKDHPEIAKEIVREYLAHFDAQNVQEAYDALNSNVQRPQLKNLLKQLIVANRPLAKSMALWFIETATNYDIQRTYETIMDIPTSTKQAAWDHVINYVTNPANRVVIYDLGIYFVQNITAEEAGAAYNTLKTTNPAVKNDFRDKLNYYIDQYLQDHPANVDANAVKSAVNNYLQEHPRIPLPDANDCVIDICTMKQQLDSVQH
jgi:DNA-binding protein Fis